MKAVGVEVKAEVKAVGNEIKVSIKTTEEASTILASHIWFMCCLSELHILFA